jgi:radical SAM superfamily enzyme YgiQ (UPF0313 family)
MSGTNKLHVVIVQQGVWNMPLESMPLAAGYLRSMILEDSALNDIVHVEVRNFRGGIGRVTMANELLKGSIPDVLAFSVYGWNFYAFGALASTFKCINPAGVVIFGGTHVAHQAERVFRLYPEVDVVVNGEGELSFRALVRAIVAGRHVPTLADVPGISYVDEGAITTTEPARQIADLDEIPSPLLTNSLPFLDERGHFRYDVALMETNRGCPYKCAFCYWGGAVGQKVRAFSMDRLRAELRIIGEMKVHTVVACDANFGLLPQDMEFVEALIETRDKYGFPRSLETSWAKNKSRNFYEIVRRMKQAGMRSSFTLALQTLSDEALQSMNRRNMKLNDWEDLVTWLADEGLDCYAELIWGAPGETPESFLAGYDRLARKVSRIAVYPMLLLPNTDYVEKRGLFNIVSVRGDTDDFEYILRHHSMSFAENIEIQRFIFWARVIAENAVLRYIWQPLQTWGGLIQSRVLMTLDEYVMTSPSPHAEQLRRFLDSAVGATESFGAAIEYLFTVAGARDFLREWWTEKILPALPAEHRALLTEIFEYDLLTQPVVASAADDPAAGMDVVDVGGNTYFVHRDVEIQHDVVSICNALRGRAEPDLSRHKRLVDLYFMTGSESVVGGTNHEIVMYYMGRTSEQMRHLLDFDLRELSKEATKSPVTAQGGESGHRSRGSTAAATA